MKNNILNEIERLIEEGYNEDEAFYIAYSQLDDVDQELLDELRENI